MQPLNKGQARAPTALYRGPGAKREFPALLGTNLTLQQDLGCSGLFWAAFV